MSLHLLLGTASNDMESQFGIEPKYVILQLLSFVLIIALVAIPVTLAFKASIKAARTFDGFLAIAWVLVCWFLPIIGPLAAFAASKRHTDAASSTPVSTPVV